MSEVDDGILRAYLDGDPILDGGARARVEAALARDRTLAERLERLRMDADAVDGAFARLMTPEPDAVQIERAYRHVRTQIDAEQKTGLMNRMKERVITMTNQHRAALMRRWAVAGTISAVALVLLLIFAPVGSAVSAALNVFRYQPTQFAVITVKTSDFPQLQANSSGAKATGAHPAGTNTQQDQQQMLRELSKYVTVTSSIGQGQLPGREVKSAAEAQAVVGRAVSAPTYLPQGVANTPNYYVSDHETADATLHLNEIRPVLAQQGMASLLPPSGDTATVHVDAPAASIISYGFDPTALQGTAAKQQKGIAVVAMGTPTVDVQGLDVQSIVTIITAAPGFPPDLAAQLKKADLQHTLILPVTDQQTVKNGTINGAPSTIISQNDGSGAVAFWITKDNVLHAVFGTYDGATIEKVAQSVG